MFEKHQICSEGDQDYDTARLEVQGPVRGLNPQTTMVESLSQDMAKLTATLANLSDLSKRLLEIQAEQQTYNQNFNTRMACLLSKLEPLTKSVEKSDRLVSRLEQTVDPISAVYSGE